MTFEDFVNLVEKMRIAQSGFFTSDKNSALHRKYLEDSRYLERQVDKAIADLKSRQTKLF